MTRLRAAGEWFGLLTRGAKRRTERLRVVAVDLRASGAKGEDRRFGWFGWFGAVIAFVLLVVLFMARRRLPGRPITRSISRARR